MKMADRLERLHQNTMAIAGAFLETAKDGKSFVCPCGHGSGKAKKKGTKNEGDGLTFTADGRWHCFTCGHKGDIVDLYQYKHGVDFNKAVDELEALLGLTADYTPAPAKGTKSPEEVIAEFEKLAFSPLTDSYRGLSVETLGKYRAKGCREFLNPLKAGTIHGSRAAVVFPTSGGRYFVRAINHKEGERCDKWDIGGKRPFNLEALQGGRPVFVVEGVIDALSIIEAGGEAIGLSGTEGIKPLVEALKESPFPNGLLIAADNDEAGQKAAKRWQADISAAGADCEMVDTAALFDGCKDANEALQKDRDGLAHRIFEVTAHEAETMNPWAAGLSELERNVSAGRFEPIPTGIKNIDNMLGGGFVASQLVVLGAEPGKGKTAFCQWLAESMAVNREDFSCLYFCFEMAREQLQARSISRLLHEQGQDLSALDVLRGKFGWRDGVEAYKRKIADKVAYFGLGSGLHTSDINEVLRIMQEGIKYNASIGRPSPFIVVDYLQLVDVEGKDEQEALKTVMERLKEFAVKNNTVVVGIVAHNRESNKNGEVSLYSGRGSSSIEYGADIVLGLAYTEMLDNRKLEEVQHKNLISLVMTKGRFYNRDSRADFDFNGKYSEFVPVDRWGQNVSKQENKALNSLLGLEPR